MTELEAKDTVSQGYKNRTVKCIGKTFLDATKNFS